FGNGRPFAAGTVFDFESASMRHSRLAFSKRVEWKIECAELENAGVGEVDPCIALGQPLNSDERVTCAKGVDIDSGAGGCPIQPLQVRRGAAAPPDEIAALVEIRCASCKDRFVIKTSHHGIIGAERAVMLETVFRTIAA